MDRGTPRGYSRRVANRARVSYETFADSAAVAPPTIPAIATFHPRLDASSAALPAPKAILPAKDSGSDRPGKDGTNALAIISPPALATEPRRSHGERANSGRRWPGVAWSTVAIPICERKPLAAPSKTLAARLRT